MKWHSLFFDGRCSKTPCLFGNLVEQKKSSRKDYVIDIDALRTHITKYGYAGINVNQFKVIMDAKV